MKLRKFLIFFVLVFFLLNMNVFSSSIFDIENITSLPYDAENNDYIIGYHDPTKNIIIAVHRSSRDVKFFNITEDGVYDENGTLLDMFYRVYKPETGEWSIAIGHEYSTWFTELGSIPCYSNKNVYRNGQICIYGKKYGDNLGVLGGLSSSVIFIGLLKPFLKLMPFILTFIVLLFALFKAWKFVKEVFL